MPEGPPHRVQKAARGTPLQDQKPAVIQPPDDKTPTGAVPEPAEKEHEEQVCVRAKRALPVAAQRDVEIIAKPGAQADMPTPPELPDTLGNVGPLKIFQKLEAEHMAQAN